MPATKDHPYIRDILTIDQRVQDYYNGYVGSAPMYLIGREVRNAEGFQFRVRSSMPVVIVADLYDGNGGLIDARGNDSGEVGGQGAHGLFPNPAFFRDPSGIDIPIAPGGGGFNGGTGGVGGIGGNVLVHCRRSVNAVITVAGGRGGPGGNGGNGSAGVHGVEIAAHIERVDNTPDDPFDFEFTDVEVPAQTIAGTVGGDGGGGGSGGPGGTGGEVQFTSIVDDTPPNLIVNGGDGGPGGFGGAAGVSGNLAGQDALPGPEGSPGAFGADGQFSHTNLSETDWVAGLRTALELSGHPFANHWAPYRIAVGDYFYHRHNDSAPGRGDFSRLAAIEFSRALEMQPGNVEALRLQAQLVGTPRTLPSGEVTWVGGGNNALGLPPDFDVLPDFEAYMRPFTAFGTQALTFLTQGTSALLAATTLAALQSMVGAQVESAESARANLNVDLDLAIEEKRVATLESDGVERQLTQTTADIQAALAEMQDEPFTIGAFVGTVAEVAVVVVGVVAAIPTAGASLVAVVPAVVALAETAFDAAGPVADAVFAGEDPDTKAVEKAYEKVDKKSSQVIAASKRIVNFVKVIQRLTASTTPDNAKHVALIKRAAELAHQAMLAVNRVGVAEQRVDGTRAKLSRADETVARARAVLKGLATDADAVRHAGLLAISVAGSTADALVGMAFRAQRSVEIYTLKSQEANVPLDTGLLHPDDWRRYDEEEIREPELHALLTASWGQLMLPIKLQQAYTDFFDQDLDKDRLRLSFEDDELEALRTTGKFSFRVNAADLPAEHFDAKVRRVRVAFVGASHPDGEVSCEVRHGGAYEQRRPPDGEVTVQLLRPRLSTVITRFAPLQTLPPDDAASFDAPLSAPTSLRMWGRGVGGEWDVAIAKDPGNAGIDLSGLTQVQVWIDYLLVR